jgi:hypothetical protein
MAHGIATRSTLNDWIAALRTPLALGLAALLAVQLLAALLLDWGGRGTLNPAAADTPLLAFDPKAITALRIQGGGQDLVLSRGDTGWLVASLGDFPAEGAKVDALLDKLAGLKRPLPVATSRDALARHKVADDRFERKMTLEVGDQAVATLLLGDSPGFKRQFVRPGDESAIYDLDLPLFEVSNRTDDWLVRDQLRLDTDKVSSIAAGDWTLTKGKDGWELAGSDAKPDAAAVTNLLNKLGSFGYRGVLGTVDQPEYDQAAPVLDLHLQLSDGTPRGYRISKLKDSEDYVLKAADQPWYFRLSAFDLEGLKDMNRDLLLGKKPAVPAGEASAPTSADETTAPAEAKVPAAESTQTSGDTPPAQ